MALLGRTEVGLKRVGQAVAVAQDPRAQLMYYLDCMCSVLNIENSQGDLTRLRNYSAYYYITEDEIDKLLILCILLSPDELEDKCIFHDESMCGESNNRFYELSAVQHRLLVTDTILIGGQTTRVQKIMCYKMAWMRIYYILPIAFYHDRLRRIANAVQGRPSTPQRPQITYYSNQPVYQRQQSSSGCCTIL